MNIKNELQNIKLKLTQINQIRQEKVLNHPKNTSDIFRFHYFEYYQLGETYKSRGHIDCKFDLFRLPKGMSYHDAFKVLSFLKDYLELETTLEKDSYPLVLLLNDVLNLEGLEFKKISSSKEVNPIELFITVGITSLFFTKYRSHYFKWYIPNVSLAEVTNIYKKIDLEFIIPQFVTEKDPDNPTLVRKVVKDLETKEKGCYN